MSAPRAFERSGLGDHPSAGILASRQDESAIERSSVARSYLTADPAELTEEIRLYLAWVQRLLNNSRAPAQHHRLYVQFGYLTSILAQLSLAQGDHGATKAHCAAAIRAADAAGDGQLRAWIPSGRRGGHGAGAKDDGALHEGRSRCSWAPQSAPRSPCSEAYLRKLSEGKTPADARRALKRRLANVVYRRILADQR